MAQVQSLHAKMLVDSRMRDIRRRVEVIQKKLVDLQEMGVPCAFCYSSVRNTGSIFTLGDKRITEVIERYRNEILCNMMEDGVRLSDSHASSSLQEIHLILPVLPAPLEELSRSTLQSMIVGILKDLGIRWSDPKPVWWPEDIPFVPPRSVPESFSGPGNWLSALRSILKSVYGYFSYDIDSYIASKLESQSVNRDGLAQPTIARPIPNRHESTAAREDESEETEDGSETDDASDPDDLRDSGSNVCRSAGSEFDVEQSRIPVADSLPTTNYHAPANPVPTSPHVVGNSSFTLPQKQATNRPVSSFTVESILMGNKQSSTSASGPITTSVTHSPASSHSITSLPSPTHSRPISSSIVGVNWVSHPPVKYTKFTILSPTAMSDDAANKKKRASESSSTATTLMTKSSESLDSLPPPSSHSSSPLTDTPLESARHLQGQRSSLNHRTNSTSASPLQVYSLSSLSPSSTASSSSSSSSSSLREPQPLPLAASTSSAKVCPLPVVTTLQTASSSLDKKVVLSKTFPPSQQYVLLVPSSSSSGTPVSHMVPATVPYEPSSKNLQGTTLTRPSMAAVSFHNPTISTSSPPSGGGVGRLDRSVLSSSSGSSSPGPDPNTFRLIAPKMKRSSSSGSSSMSSSRGRSSQGRLQQRSSGSKPPQKLRFHMTTVVTRQKRMPVKSSMTVESPSSVMNERTDHSRPSNGRHSQSSDSDVPVESMITRSPNLFSISSSPSALKTAEEEKAHEMQDYPSTPGSSTGEENRPAHLQNGMRQHAAVVGLQNGMAVASRNGSPPQSRSNPGSAGARGRQGGTHTLQTKEQNHHNSSTSTLENHSMHLEQSSKETTSSTRQRRRATRSYTRRKRELTFHLYEEPAAFKAKRACKE